jgi:hypothetical protein
MCVAQVVVRIIVLWMVLTAFVGIGKCGLDKNVHLSRFDFDAGGDGWRRSESGP